MNNLLMKWLFGHLHSAINVIDGIASDGVTPVIFKFTNINSSSTNGNIPISDGNCESDFTHPDDVQNITSSVKYSPDSKYLSSVPSINPSIPSIKKNNCSTNASSSAVYTFSSSEDDDEEDDDEWEPCA